MTTKPDEVQRLLEQEPFVRALAHSLVADEADDVVQQAFLRALEQRPSGVTQPRSWLARIVRNLAIDHRRRAARRDARHHAAAPRDLVPSSSELLEGEERRRALVAAVDALPADQRTVVLLRYYDGLPPRRIAAELGMPVATVWNRLHAALQTLRARLDAAYGERRAWLLPLVPFATTPRSLPWHELAAPAGKTLIGATVMTTKTKLVAALAGVLVLAMAWIVWPDGERSSDRQPPPGAGAVPQVARADRERDRTAAAGSDEPTREAADAPNVPAATTGTLVVRALYAAESTAAAGVTVTIGRPGDDFRVGLRRSITDAEGRARFDALMPGTWRVWSPLHATTRVRAEVAAGSTCGSTLPLQGGMTLTGLVVDRGGVPIGGAIVEAAMAGVTELDADQVAVTAADGTFTLRECYMWCLVGARAEGHAASQLYYREGTRGSTEHVRIELGPGGGAVDGLVVSPTGEPVASAVVRVGDGSTEGIVSTNLSAPPLPAQVRTDAVGRFRAIGVPAGKQPVQVRTADLAPWRGTCEVTVGATVTLRIAMTAGVTCTGIVRGDGGEPAADARVGVGDTGDFVLLRTRSGTDGTFTLTGLPVDEFVVAAQKDRVGKATATLRARAGETVRCELQLSHGLALAARVLDTDGAPLARAEVRVRAEGEGARWSAFAFSGEDGRCVIADCPPGRTLALLASKSDYVTLQRQAVQPGGPELELRLERDTAAKARITGRLLRTNGTAAAGERVEMWSPQTATQPQLDVSVVVRDDGTFVIEAPSAKWTGVVRVKGHPEIRFDPGTLAAGAAWDAGVLQLTDGGTLLVRVDGYAPQTDTFSVRDASERWVCSPWSPSAPLQSDLIAPGDYVLLAQGDGVVTHLLPFTIHIGRETELTVPRVPGTRQWIDFELAAGVERPSYVEFQVHRGATLAAWNSASGENGAPFRKAVWLAPGSYTLATKNREPQTTATFTVGATEGPPLRVVVR